LFDGVCNLCNSSVQFVIQRDSNKVFRYAALQSDFAKNLLESLNQPAPDVESVILVDGDAVFYRSNAALRIAKHLKGAWPMLSIFLIVPRFIRDAVYNFIGRNRYKWFGKQESCMIPTPELKELFLG
jgi:predicted DCC family thiol-disulfide oxidoreductase YuxK